MPSPPTQIAKKIHSIAVADEMRDSFMPYALSVTTSRAIPDVRDGLKPVQRRILYVMDRLGLRPGTPYRKSAGVVGEVMGKYHPHGDSAIYEAMVRLGQTFAMSVPLVAPKGNFGSLDDPPAAYRYTEARLNDAAGLMAAGLDEDTVDFTATFDGERREPACLPAAFPNLIVNGASGIAVGMATSLPPHNLAEAVAAVKLVLNSTPRRKPKIEDVLEVMAGPDFPSGGVIAETADTLADIYRTGRGAIRVRAVAAIEQATARRSRIVITELPYMVGPERVAGRIRELVAAEKLDGIAAVEDHTDRHHGMRLVVQCKPGHDANAVLERLWTATPLQDTFSVNSIALADGVPQQMPFLELCERWVTHRLEVIRRRTRHRLDKAEARAHIVEGLLVALDRIDETVKIIRRAQTPAEARETLQAKLGLTEIQAGHILDMQLRRLTALETGKLRRELEELQAEIRRCEAILASDKRQRTIIAKELDSIAEQHSTPRRTRIGDAPENLSPAMAAADSRAGADTSDGTLPLSAVGSDTLRVTVSVSGLIGAADTETGARFKPGRHDTLASNVTVPGGGSVGIVTSRGRLVTVDSAALPRIAGRSRGDTVRSLIGAARNETAVAAVPLDMPVAVIASDGTAKRIDPSKMSRRPAELQIVPDKTAVVAAFPAPDSAEIVMVSSVGHALRFPATALTPRGPQAGTVNAMKLPAGADVVAAGAVFGSGVAALLVADTAKPGPAGMLKVTDVSEISLRGRGGAGMAAVKLPAGTAVTGGWVGADGAILVGSATHPMPAATRRTAAPIPVDEPISAAGERRR